MTKRRRFSESQVLETLYWRGVEIMCLRCHLPFKPGERVEREHLHEIALGGPDEPSNCAYSHKSCHAIITNGTKATSAGSSKHRIAKGKRLRGETCTKPSKPIPSRPFDKKRTRKFNGQVVPRTPVQSST